LIPATLASGVGSDVQRPLATVIVGGLFSALLLVLTVLPSLYLILVGERKTYGVSKKTKDLEPYSYLDQYTMEEYEAEEVTPLSKDEVKKKSSSMTKNKKAKSSPGNRSKKK
jgi:heavy metal efflux system protein